MEARRTQLWSVTALTMVLSLVIGTGVVLAGQTATQEPSQSDMGDEGKMERCRALMNDREAMLREIAAMDAQLDELRAELSPEGESRPGRALPPGAGAWPSNEWEWTRNLSEVTADVEELIAHSKSMHRVMEAMQPRMMSHMMEDMSSPKDETRQPMVDCPMMKQMPSASEEGGQEEHSTHHPNG